MTPKAFAENWASDGSANLPINSERLKAFGLQAETIHFLIVGLPESAAPFLSFYGDAKDGLIVERLEDHYNFEVECDKYIVIGSDGEGNPIAVNTKKNDLVELLDHENDFTPTYCNASVRHLATFLVIYRGFVNDVRNGIPEDAFFDEHFTDEQYQTLRQKMTTVDPDALNNKGLWKRELQNLIANREYYRGIK